MRILIFSLVLFGFTLARAQAPENFHRTIGGKAVDLYTLRNDAGIEMTITNYGGRIVSLKTPDRMGRQVDVVSGYGSLDGYLKSNEVYFGALIGRCANRIAGGQFSINGKTYTVPKNNGPNALHGGPEGFHNQVWKAMQLDARTLILEYTSPDGEMGFPGNLTVRATYQLAADKAEFTLQFDAVADKPTIVNLTNHAFFNLSGEGETTINDHLLRIAASRYSTVDKDLIPNGLGAVDVAFDFRKMHAIGKNIDLKTEQLKFGNGYDHNYALDDYRPGLLREAATVYSPKSGISMTLSTTEPGLQFYGGNFLQGKDRGKSGRAYGFRSLFCLEPQYFPNAINDRNAGSTLLLPGEHYTQVTSYNFRNDLTYNEQRGKPAAIAAAPARWSETKALDWRQKQPWRVGSNFIASYAINQLEMFQNETFDTLAIERELKLAAGIGMNTMRIFLHDLLYRQNPAAFKQKLDTVLRICARNGIQPMIVFFDSVWNGEAKLGKQPDPIPGVHNSGWVKSPNLRDLANPWLENELLYYVYDVVSTFKDDPRIYMWDVWNEPDNTDNARATHGMCSRNDVIAYLLPKVFATARAAQPTQPLTSGVWWGWEDWADDAKLTPIRRIQLAESDIISFHCYSDSAAFEYCVRQLSGYGRPLVCTEYLARSMGSTFEKILPIGKKYKIDMINWGLVQGKTQTHFPWDSWQEPYTTRPLPIWHHEVFQNDGKPYRQQEVDLIRRLTAKQ